MSETANKKKEISPESYSPKKPEILNMAKNSMQNEQNIYLPPEFLIAPKDKIAAFSGNKWPYSNVTSSFFAALGLFYGQTEKRNNSGELINDDKEYSIQNVLTGEAFGLFYSLPDNSLSMAAYGLISHPLNIEDYPEEQLVKTIQGRIFRGNAVFIRKFNIAHAYFIWGYKDNGNVLLGCEFEDGNDNMNCSYNFENPADFDSWTKDITQIVLCQLNGEKLPREFIYKQALANGYRMLTQTEPNPEMDFERVHFGYGQAIYDEWVRHLEKANAENSEVYYFSAPVFPHFLALYENRLHLYKFLKTYSEMCGDVNLQKSAELCKRLKDFAIEAAQIGFKNDHSKPEILAMTNNERRNLLIDLLINCRALELEIAEHIKIFLNTPESYSPKMPEILNMAKESAVKTEMDKICEVKTANGGSFIDNVPLLKWGEWKDNTYCGCVTALLNATGISVSYEEVMGLSGVCYQAIMRDDWDPSSQMPQNGNLCESNVANALGISIYTLKEEIEIREQAKKSIDSGFPVLLVGGKWEPEWTLACGYAFENGEAKFFGRTYFDYKSASVPENEIYTENKYFYLNRFPGLHSGALTRFYDKKCEPISRKQALKVSLETCILMFEQKPGQHGHKFGYDAYDVLIQGFELEESEYQAKCRNDQYHIGSMQDARRAAYMYLNASADLLDEENKVKLMKTAEIFKTMVDNMLTAVPYEKTAAIFNGSANPVWDMLQRLKLAEALKENKRLEKQVRVIVADILTHWEK